MPEYGKHTNVKAGGGQSYLVFTDIITVKVTGAETGGKYLIVEAISPPGSGPSFLHTHIPQETFQVLEGAYEIYGRNEDGKYAISATPGMVVHVPGGKPHGFKNVGDSPGRMILTYEPAQPMLEFFKEVGIPVEDKVIPPQVEDPLDADQVMAIFAKHHMNVLEPLPGP